jgi:hypothetical protein
MLFEDTVAVYCENHTEHTDTVRTSQETHYFSATETNRLMLFGETVAVYCENHTENIVTLFEQKKVKVKLILLPTASRPVCVGVRHPSGTHNQFFSFSV